MRLAAVVLLAGCGRIAFDARVDAADAQTDAPSDAVDPDMVIDIAAGGFATCALLARGDVYCWGRGDVGRLGNGDEPDRADPRLVNAPVKFVAIEINDGGTCGLVGDGTVWCWGYNLLGGLGLGTNLTLQMPRELSRTNIVEIAIGLFGSCIRLAGGTVQCAGRGDTLGDGTGAARQVFVDVVGVTDAFELAMGEGHACILGADGQPRCWGSNAFGELGDGTTTTPALLPVQGPAIAYDEIHLGDSHTCARRGGEVDCWGRNDDGELGDGTLMSRSTASEVLNLTDATSLALSAFGACALRADGTVVCWGDNQNNQLGRTGADSPNPLLVAGLSDVVEISSRTGLHNCARTRDGRVYCWGSNQYGQCGDPALATDLVVPRLITFP